MSRVRNALHASSLQVGELADSPSDYDILHPRCLQAPSAACSYAETPPFARNLTAHHHYGLQANLCAGVLSECMFACAIQEQAAKRDALIRDVQEALQDMSEAQQSLASAEFEKSQIQASKASGA